MRLWRISDHASLSGEGGLNSAGRWHSRGRPVVYLADHPASALLEVMVHLEVDAEDWPRDYQLLGINLPDSLTIGSTDESSLPLDWREQTLLTRARGDEWLRVSAAALLRVPSAIVPEAANYLLNPGHADAARIVIASAIRAAFDPRLMAFTRSSS
jgi:RES domain-containing protein